MLILTSSPTTTPPPSMLAFHFTPKSWRLTLVDAFTATLECPQGSLIGAVGPSTSRTTSFVTPWMVKSPVIFSWPGAACSTFLDLKLIVGYFATSKKSALFRCALRCGSRVSKVDASIVTSTVDLVMSLSSQLTMPVTPWNSPRTVEIIRCLTANCAEACCGSICHEVGTAAAGKDKTAASPAAAAILEMR